MMAFPFAAASYRFQILAEKLGAVEMLAGVSRVDFSYPFPSSLLFFTKILTEG